MCGVYKPTNVVSTSYGEAEIDLPEYYQKRQCNEYVGLSFSAMIYLHEHRYMKLGLQGHTFLFSSGDSGVGGFPGDASESGCLGPDATVFNPQFPVKYVLLVLSNQVMLHY